MITFGKLDYSYHHQANFEKFSSLQVLKRLIGFSAARLAAAKMVNGSI